MSALIDISPTISARTAVFPGDVSFERTVSMDCDRGDHLTLSSIRSTVHLGSHADAPNHYLPGGRAIHEQSLELYYGPCQVIQVRGARGRRIVPDDLTTSIEAPRVLFRTDSFPDVNAWKSDFSSLSPALIDVLQRAGVRLVGIDTPSVDPAESTALESHQAVAQHDLAILEGLVLSHVAPGAYTLVALPLKLLGADASPVRAALLPAV